MSYNERNIARAIAKGAFRIMLTQGKYAGKIGDYFWTFDADAWSVSVRKSETLKVHTFTPAKSWAE